jgi:hypothetical protein
VWEIIEWCDCEPNHKSWDALCPGTRGRSRGRRALDHQQSINKFTSEDRWYSAIGRFISEFSQLEYTLKYYIAEAIGLSEQHFNAIASQFDFAKLCALAEYVLLHRAPTRPFR